MKYWRFGLVLFVLALLAAKPVAAIAGTWNVTGSMAVARSETCAVLLPNGKVLVTGGLDADAHPMADPELYDPVAKTWSAAAPMGSTRQAHTCTLLADGRVLMAGGINSAVEVLDSYKLYDPDTNSWSQAKLMGAARYSHTATLLNDGKILVAGGFNDSDLNPVVAARLYDPTTDEWTATGSLNVGRWGHTATLLQNGKVLVVGGSSSGTGFDTLTSAELYDPVAGTWTETDPLNIDRSRHSATLLSNGKVLVAGGEREVFTILDSSELYDPLLETWSSTGPLATARWSHTATLLPDGKVLVAGGYNSATDPISSAELYNPVTGNWTATSSLPAGRVDHTAVLLANGKVLVSGGYVFMQGTVASALIFNPLNQVETFRSTASQDGWVLESSETSEMGGSLNSTGDTVWVGDDAGDRQYRAILSFNTSSLPDNAVITKATLKIWKWQGANSTFTTHGGLLIDIRRGGFAGNPVLQPADFQAAAHKQGVGTIKPGGSPGWNSGTLKAIAFPYINLTGVTQIRLRFALGDNDNRIMDAVGFYSGSGPSAYRPRLVLQFTVP